MIKPDFRWWMGVVEDRADPDKMGRYRVRIMGYHTEDRTLLPTAELPWATPIMPLSSASNTGVCETPYLVEGSAVIGFFSDGADEQHPVIMGSLPGMPRQKIVDPNIGFSDPTGEYPRYLDEPDIPKLARDGAAEKHESLIDKRYFRLGENVPPVVTAKAPHVSSLQADKAGKDYTGQTWEEPHPRFGSTATGTYTEPGKAPTFDEGTTSVYPFNQVKETESGHVFEIDDTPANGRIHEYHNAGTFREIQADGTRVTKVVGEDYEIVLQGKNVFIEGGCNVSVIGNCKLRVDGDYYQEVNGDYFLSVTGDRVVKVDGNDMLEVGTDQGINVEKNRGVRIGIDDSETVIGAQTHSVGKTKTTTVSGDVSETHLAKMTTIVSDTYNMMAGSDLGIASGSNISIGAETNITETAGGNITEKASGNVDTEAGVDRNETAAGVITETATSINMN